VLDKQKADTRKVWDRIADMKRKKRHMVRAHLLFSKLSPLQCHPAVSSAAHHLEVCAVAKICSIRDNFVVHNKTVWVIIIANSNAKYVKTYL
jgi:hypothetical protein